MLEFGDDEQAALSFSQKANSVVNLLFSSMVGSLQEQLNFLEGKTQKEMFWLHVLSFCYIAFILY